MKIRIVSFEPDNGNGVGGFEWRYDNLGVDKEQITRELRALAEDNNEFGNKVTDQTIELPIEIMSKISDLITLWVEDYLEQPIVHYVGTTANYSICGSFVTDLQNEQGLASDVPHNVTCSMCEAFLND